MVIKNIHTYISFEVADLDKIARQFLKEFPSPGIFAVTGEMGSGKTSFVSAICRQLNYEFQGSPTFSLVNEYKSPSGVDLLHFDLYRVKNLREAMDFGIEEYLDHNAYIFIEWPEVIEDLLPSKTFHVSIELKEENRLISF